MTDIYLIWSNEHRAWWKTGGWAYSTGLRSAGQFSRAQAIEICQKALRQAAINGAIAEIPVRYEDVMDVLRDQVVPDVILGSKNG
jgi:hypothetical protein